jgi:hypothetical protein
LHKIWTKGEKEEDSEDAAHGDNIDINGLYNSLKE